MTTDDILKSINNSNIKSLTEFSTKCSNLFPDLTNRTVIHKRDMGVWGILAFMRCYNGMDEILIKGFLYPSDNWSEDTHGYIKAKRI